MQKLWRVGLLVGLIASVAAAEPQVRPLITPQDYPLSAIQGHHEGTVQVRLLIASDGHVKGCTVVQSSGYADLDLETCEILRHRARFKVSPDGQETVITPAPVTWSLPQ